MSVENSENIESLGVELSLESVLAQVVEVAKNNGLEVEVIGEWIWISGTNKTHAPILKSLNLKLKWHAKKQKWFFAGCKAKSFGKEYSIEQIKTKYGCQKVA